jgi:hypothetical protein
MDGSSALYKYIKRNHDAKISPGLKLSMKDERA